MAIRLYSNKTTNKCEPLYERVIANYQNCQKNPESLSDTWAHTLAQKGEPYTLEEMVQMRFPGNRVNSWMVDSLFLVDRTILDLNNPIILRLLELGESEFGNPRKDTKVMNSFYSSLFLVDVIHAARIIQLIEDMGLTHPRVMDIGGGSGLLLSLLKRYFGDRITLFFVDIPETLLIQEWYLRNCFPDAKHVYKSSKKEINFIQNGMNFVNAYVLESQDTEFDVVCNLASMQEMTEDTIQTYLKYIEKNISENGIFYFSNRFGHSSACIKEPSEYGLGAQWDLEFSWMGYPIYECKNAWLLGCIYRRTKARRDLGIRRLVLRILWNGYPAGLFSDEKIIKELIEAVNSPNNSADEIIEIVQKYRIDVDQISLLQNDRYFSQEFYIKNQPHSDKKSELSVYTNHYLEETSRDVEVEIIQEMKKVASLNGRVSVSSTRAQLNNISSKFLEFEDKPLNSEYWTARFAGILLTLGQSSQAEQLIKLCCEYTDHKRWLVRFAILFFHYGFLENSQSVLSRLDDDGSDLFISLKRIELEYGIGKIYDELANRLSKIASSNDSNPVIQTEIAKVAAKIGAFDILKKSCSFLNKKNIFAQTVGNPFFRIFSASIASFSKDQALDLIQENYNSMQEENMTPAIQLEYGALLLQLGEEEKGLGIIKNSTDILKDSYFSLGRAGYLLKKIGYKELADDYLQQSLNLRPDHFMHYEFIGSIYFSSGEYGRADQYLRKAAALKPYLRGTCARAIYCTLPDSIRDAGIFGDGSNLNIIFEQDQNFYNDSPNWK